MIELIKDVFHFFNKNIRPITLLTLIIETPFILIDNIKEFTKLSPLISFWAFLILVGAAIVIYPFSMGAQIVLYSNIVNGEEYSLKGCILKSRYYLPKMIISSLIYTIITALGLIALIIPGIIIATRCSLYGFLIINEGYDPIPSLKRSAQLTKEITWQMANPLILIFLILFVIQTAIFSFLNIIGLYNFLFSSMVDFAFSIISWISLILLFRFYCFFQNA